jgi:hypothetical protein
LGIDIHGDARVGATDPSTRCSVSNLGPTIGDHAAKESEAHDCVIDGFNGAVILDPDVSFRVEP